PCRTACRDLPPAEACGRATLASYREDPPPKGGRPSALPYPGRQPPDPCNKVVSADTVRRFTARFARYGFRPDAMAPVYGLAESAVGLAFPPLGREPVIDRVRRAALAEHGRAEPASTEDADAVEFVACGRPLRGHDIRIIGPTGELGDRQEGPLQFRGPSATSGYFADPEKTAELFDGDWLNSGDLAYVAAGDV